MVEFHTNRTAFVSIALAACSAIQGTQPTPTRAADAESRPR